MQYVESNAGRIIILSIDESSITRAVESTEDWKEGDYIALCEWEGYGEKWTPLKAIENPGGIVWCINEERQTWAKPGEAVYVYGGEPYTYHEIEAMKEIDPFIWGRVVMDAELWERVV